jgi:hypothetical protein
MFVSLHGVVVEGNVFAFLVEVQVGCNSQTIGQSGLTVESM